MTHLRQCLTTFSNTSKFLKNTLLRVKCLTRFAVFGNVAKRGLSCLTYHLRGKKWKNGGRKVQPATVHKFNIW